MYTYSHMYAYISLSVCVWIWIQRILSMEMAIHTSVPHKATQWGPYQFLSSLLKIQRAYNNLHVMFIIWYALTYIFNISLWNFGHSKDNEHYNTSTTRTLGSPFNPFLPPIFTFPLSQETTNLLSVRLDQILFSRIHTNRILGL